MSCQSKAYASPLMMSVQATGPSDQPARMSAVGMIVDALIDAFQEAWKMRRAAYRTAQFSE
jgi:hypothetical protein